MDPLEVVRHELAIQRREEEAARAKRIMLEQLLRKLERGEKPEQRTSIKRRYRRNEIIAWLMDILSDGSPRTLKEIIAEISERAGDTVPESTIRSILSGDDHFRRVGVGVYALAQQPMTEDDVPF